MTEPPGVPVAELLKLKTHYTQTLGYYSEYYFLIYVFFLQLFMMYMVLLKCDGLRPSIVPQVLPLILGDS